MANYKKSGFIKEVKPRTYLQHQSSVSNLKIRTIHGAGKMLLMACDRYGMKHTSMSLQLIIDALVYKEKRLYQELKKKHLEKAKKKIPVDIQAGL